MMRGVEALISQDFIERVPPDVVRARALLAEARRHLSSTQVIVDDDPDGAYALLFDAARKAVSARMLADGYRAKSDRPGAHRAVVLYAEAVLTEHSSEHVAHFDRIRRTRNRSEYGPREISRGEVVTDLSHAAGIVSAVELLYET